MKILTNVLMIIGVIAILFAGFVGVGVILYSLTPPVKAKMTVTPVTAETAKSYDKKVEAFIKDIEISASAAKEKEVTLTISEQEVNSKIIASLAEGKLPLAEMMVNLKEDVCWGYAAFTNPGIATKVGLIAQVKIVDGKFKVTPVDFQLGNLPLPSSVKEQVGSILDIIIRIQAINENLPLRITGIKISDGQFTLKGMTKINK